ncbi:MAG: hypothetical protein A2W00_10000 [Candidatus Eisenbacteria bacterium RBG_16_71_46]|nr:MAG: hypothetical protein A2W00_10000 [Candidatus Eisenbacteria bacterium RBG_16_71_46]
MTRLVPMLVMTVLAFVARPVALHAAVNVERQGAENPVIEIAKSTVYGGLAGLVVGGAIALASDSNDNDGDIVRWSFIGGTFVGLGYGIYQVSNRPQPTALLEFRGGAASLHAALPAPVPGRGMTMRLVAVRF